MKPIIHIIHSPASAQQISEMLLALRDYIKVAVDVRRGILAGGGILHADCEGLLMDHGCPQEDVWGADWIPSSGEVRYEALINIRPRQQNRSMVIQNPDLQRKVAGVVRHLLGGL